MRGVRSDVGETRNDVFPPSEVSDSQQNVVPRSPQLTQNVVLAHQLTKVRVYNM